MKHLGQAKIEYDDDVDGYRVIFDDDSEENLVNHIICQVCTHIYEYHTLISPIQYFSASRVALWCYSLLRYFL